MSDMARLSVIIVSYNTRDLTLAAIRALYENAGHPFELIIIDNASDDGSADAIEDEFPTARLIRSSRNRGFAGANNEAARYATGDALLLLNPDTEVLPGAIDRLMALRAEWPQAGVWGGRTIYADGTPNPASCWRRQTLWSLLVQATGLSSLARRSQLLNPERVLKLSPSEPTPVDIVSGCLLLIDRALFERLGGFSPRFFMYGEDADLCLRAQAAGARPIVHADACIVHHGGSSERVRADKLVRLITAKSTLIQVHFPRGQKHLGLALLAAWPLSRMLAHRLLSGLGAHRYREQARAWSRVWSRRGEWLAGFPEPVA
ncbi:glycosyltransferase family 2 protein [Spiribacter vilamensis]|uniref:Glycosyltransferase family 2 protein n=1 Tax=Spiribacter vilamensis TaxID=531306 RepID=A0A4Q8CZF6_9GAMM|nr:glycosyltransferase family 2 protein [Spiribacter vilamensis]RZU98364.1 hypothetical protein EV698_0609 [Spiribacter vilamensis]TVO60753.1 glycosyltransferase family 2 protein [Spiribacter vilamensis]